MLRVMRGPRGLLAAIAVCLTMLVVTSAISAAEDAAAAPAAGAVAQVQSANAAPDLIPQPKTIDMRVGGFTADAAAVVFTSGGDGVGGAFLADAIRHAKSFPLQTRFERSADNVMWLSNTGKAPSALDDARKALAAAGPSDEAYGLVINPDGLAAAAKTPVGLLRAAATAAQLLERGTGRPSWPDCVICDWPDLALRSVYVDLKHHMEKPEYLDALVPRLAAFKINGLVIELEDKFLYTRRPEISAPVGLSAEYLQSLADRCRRYGIELIPLVQGLGHVSYILRHDEYAGLRERPDSFAEFCPLAEGTYDVLFDLYDEVAGATKGTKYFHIGGDEARLMGSCPKCAEALKTSSRFDLYNAWLTRCADHVRSLGRTPMVWDDMLLRNAGNDLSALPRDLLYVRWNYSANAGTRNKARLDAYAAAGLQVIVAAATQTDGPYVPIYEEHFANIGGFAKAAADAGLLGILTTAWEDSGNHTETFWPGYAATGACAWNSATDADFAFLEKFTRVFHGAEDDSIARAYQTLGRNGEAVFRLLSLEDPYLKNQRYLPLPPLDAAGGAQGWREKYAERIATAERAKTELGEARETLSREILTGRRDNAYALEVLLAADRIMIARVDLFLALRDSDAALGGARAAFDAGRKDEASRLLADASSGVTSALDEGETALTSLEAVSAADSLSAGHNALRHAGAQVCQRLRQLRPPGRQDARPLIPPLRRAPHGRARVRRHARAGIRGHARLRRLAARPATGRRTIER